MRTRFHCPVWVWANSEARGVGYGPYSHGNSHKLEFGFEGTASLVEYFVAAQKLKLSFGGAGEPEWAGY